MSENIFWDAARKLKEQLMVELGKVLPADKKPDLPLRSGNHQWGDGVAPVSYPPIELTRKGNRFGDVVRDSLADPESSLTKVVREFSAWKKVCQREPDDYKMELDCLGFIGVRKRLGFKRAWEFSHLSDYTDMKTWWNGNVRRSIPPAKYLEGYKP